MQKSLIAAAAFAALAFGSAGSANAGIASGQLNGVKAGNATQLAEQVHWRGHRHGWHKHRKIRKCVWRHGHRHCWTVWR